MALTNPLFASNERLQRAARNSPPMRRGERDHEGVAILQSALAAMGVATLRRSHRPDGSMDGDFGSETEVAVKRYQSSRGLLNDRGRPDGVVGRSTLHALDSGAPTSAAAASIRTAAGAIPRAETPQTTAVVHNLTVPASSAMLANYEGFRAARGKPCGRDVKHQCAVRMSVALGLANTGFHFGNWTHGNVHSGQNACGDVPRHVTGSSELVAYLQSEGLPFTQFRKSGPGAVTARQIMDQVTDRNGIIYFRRCFTDGGRVGSHIDYWDGTQVMNDRLRYNAPGEGARGTRQSDRFFRDASGDRRMPDVWFCETR